MKINRIFIDVDDVLNKFTMYALRSVGCKSVCGFTFSDSVYNPTWKYDIVRAVNNMLMGTGVKYTRKTFWDSISREVWSTTPYSDEFRPILRHCRVLVGKPKVALLTKPIDDPECWAGKCEWIRSRCPPWLRNRYFLGQPKKFLAAPDSLLIDDSDKNYDDWIAAGGQAILVPRPWNRLHGYDTAEYIEQCFRNLNRIKRNSWLDESLNSDPLVFTCGMERKSFDELNQ